MRPIADEKRVALTADVAAPGAEVVCDGARIVQVFSNLVGNAIKFTNEGGAVTVRVSGDDGTVKFAVTDTGCGIAQEELPHVFDRYWKGHGIVAGVGLGLAIVKGIVEAHHGALHAESTLGAGTTFEFDLPRAA
jgi:signal transduction histidine kinase